MNKGTIVALVALVFVAGLVFGSYSGLNEIALGRVIRDVNTYAGQEARQPVLKIIPDIARPREIMRGSVTPSANGVLSGIRFYAIDDFGNRAGIVADCSFCFCANGRACYAKENFVYELPDLGEGFYSACITESGTNRNACALFQVTA